MRIEIKTTDSFHLINHGPCNLITTGDGKRQNVAPINWTMPLNNDPPLMITVVEEGIFTDELIKASREFVINVVGESLAEKAVACGKCHGNTVNKFEKFHLTPSPSKKVKAPYIRESIAHIECKVIGQHPYEGVNIFAGKVLHAEVEEEFWDGKSLVIEKAKTIHHLTGNSFVVAERVISAAKNCCVVAEIALPKAKYPPLNLRRIRQDVWRKLGNYEFHHFYVNKMPTNLLSNLTFGVLPYKAIPIFS